jgi:hypothetical protein
MSVFTDSFPTDPKPIARELDETGFVCLKNVISDEWLDRARGYVHGKLDSHGKKFFSVIRPADEAGTPADEVTHHPLMQGLLRGLTEQACPSGVVEYEDVYNVLRVVAGARGDHGSMEFHYDASVVTALVPIFIPEGTPMQSGELVTFANRRPIRRLLGSNLIEKVIVQNRFYRQRAADQVMKNPEGLVKLLIPGNVYLFWGYRTYHGNLPCSSDALRATMLLHYGNPHGNSTTLHAIRNTRKVIESFRRTSG